MRPLEISICSSVSLKRKHSGGNWATDGWRSHEPYAIARLSKVLIIRFTIDVDTPEEGPNVTLTEAGYIDLAKGGLVKGYGRKIVTVYQARDFREVCQGVQLRGCKVENGKR